ncbi:MAG: Pyrophosphate--fructose 6-phosphate 1-phosphotransferase [Alphaproteobacteria bacterium ADurb.Bin438]|nr:MAG: Pyrophosphate--fructose 6-phosphate 1-phosphotransferase [Alphaproteobacteria bacterium ADurb.Bin438]
MTEIKRVGVLTSGGDCAGLNSVIRAVIHRAIWTYKWEVYGIMDSTEGLCFRPLRFKKLGISDFYGPYERIGGTMLGTINRGNPFAYKMPDGSVKDLTGDFKEGCEELGLDALIVIGGDGSMAIVSKLCAGAGVKMVGIPKTIDNDTPITDHSVGFATAREICVEALDRIQTTAASHHRVMILEVMGRDAGHLALHTAIAGGADICLIPEVPYTYEGVVNKLRRMREQGADHALIVVSEGVKTEDGQAVTVKTKDGERYSGFGTYLCNRLAEEPENFSPRVTLLGHVQRGGIPVAGDRIVANALGVHACDVLAEGKTDHMVVWKNNDVDAVPLTEVAKVGTQNVKPDCSLVKTARGLGIYIGE